MRKLTMLIILVATAVVALPQQMPMPKASGPQSDAQKAFEKLKTLAGSWEGTYMGMSGKVTIRATSTGNAILLEMTSPGGPDDPITMIYVDGNRLLLTHFCDSGNRPRMQGRLSPDGNTVTFDFLDVSGSAEKFLMHDVVFTLVDADHHIEAWTYSLNGKPPIRAPGIQLQRTK
ncbi:MAG TPA: hypothetical protein VNH18_21475 [Bryobacteraceae bacterium]|nr:hypothetical protein [Bryobacteraceae bacterium]